MTKNNVRIIALNVLTVPWHLYDPIDFIVQLGYESNMEYGMVIDGVCENWHQSLWSY